VVVRDGREFGLLPGHTVTRVRKVVAIGAVRSYGPIGGRDRTANCGTRG